VQQVRRILPFIVYPVVAVITIVYEFVAVMTIVYLQLWQL
jgi:hypothetical protein